MEPATSGASVSKGAVLLTGIGGSRVDQHPGGQPNVRDMLPCDFGVLTSFALYVREPRLRALIPLRIGVAD